MTRKCRNAWRGTRVDWDFSLTMPSAVYPPMLSPALMAGGDFRLGATPQCVSGMPMSLFREPVSMMKKQKKGTRVVWDFRLRPKAGPRR